MLFVIKKNRVMKTPLNRSLKAEVNFWNKQGKTYKKTIDLKYFQYEDFENKEVLDECFRILKNNGIIYIVCNIVRNLEFLVKHYLEN